MNTEDELFPWLHRCLIHQLLDLAFWSTGMTEEILFFLSSSYCKCPSVTSHQQLAIYHIFPSLNQVTSYIKGLLFFLLFVFMVSLCVLLESFSLQNIHLLIFKCFLCLHLQFVVLAVSLSVLMKNCANMNPWRGHDKVSVFLCLRQRQWQWSFIIFA